MTALLFLKCVGCGLIGILLHLSFELPNLKQQSIAANNTVELSSSAIYPGYANKVTVIINATHFTYKINGVSVTKPIVYLLWNAAGSMIGFTDL